MEQGIVLQGMTIENLLKEIELIVHKELEETITVLNLSVKHERSITPKEVASNLKISVVTVINWVKRGLM